MLDCDGVLFDSWDANVAFYDAVLRALGRPPLDEAGRDLAHRLAMPHLLERTFADDPAELDRARRVAAELDYRPFLPLMRPVRALRETLAWLRKRARTALVTNRGLTIPLVLKHFELHPYFDAVLGVLDVPRPKPAPDMVEACLDRLATAPGAAVYVGDSPGDLEAARAAGVAFVGVGLDGDRRIEELAELPRVLAPAGR